MDLHGGYLASERESKIAQQALKLSKVLVTEQCIWYGVDDIVLVFSGRCQWVVLANYSAPTHISVGMLHSTAQALSCRLCSVIHLTQCVCESAEVDRELVCVPLSSLLYTEVTQLCLSI